MIKKNDERTSFITAVGSNGEGIVKADVEATIASVGRMASAGMLGTDKEILNIMVGR